MRTPITHILIISSLVLSACSPSTKTEEDVAAIRAHLEAEAAEKDAAKAADAREMNEIKARRAAERAARGASAASSASAGG